MGGFHRFTFDELLGKLAELTESVQTIDLSPEELKEQLDRLTEWIINFDQPAVMSYVDKLRSQNPGISDAKLASMIVRRKSLKCGLVGAVAGLGGVIVLPVAVPANLVATWRFQANMAVCIAYLYGHTPETTDLKTDIYLIMAGDSVKEAFKQFGIEASKEVTKRAVEKYVTREVMNSIHRIIGRKIITKAGEKSLTSFTKMVPLIGGPIGFAFDWTTARGFGSAAIKYYSGEG
ncbi:MAG: EcsC family protein [Chloroflexota bacterium]|jgi:hypothetical protein